MKEREICLILDNIRSRENVGSIFRTADGAGVTKIYLCGITPTPKSINVNIGTNLLSEYDRMRIANDKISKTALGAESFVPWEYYKDTWRLLKKLKAQGLKLLALEQTKDAVSVFKYKALDFKPLAIIVGNEVKGISPKILKYCDRVLRIPMHGKKESLNVSVATGIAIYVLMQT